MLHLTSLLQHLFQSKENNKTKGGKGEELACVHLVEKGYNILERNWRYGRLEIDIIAEYQGTIVFVEVKSRAEDYLVEPHMAVTRKKQKSIIKAANNYIQERDLPNESRFDIVTVTFLQGILPEIEHYAGAFYASM